MLLKDDFKRYRALVILHIIGTIAFVIRFIVLCTDLSSAKSEAIAFPVVILLLELGSSFITLIANSLYVFLRYLGPILFESDREKVCCCSQSFSWNLSTLTCFRCKCYSEHPQLVLITRFIVLILFEIMRFVAFILACVCANRYSPTGLGYAILGGFSLVPAIFLLVIEYLHHHRLWFNYHPDISDAAEKPPYDDGHQRYLPTSLTHDEQTSHWQNSRCDKGTLCSSRNLYHAIMYHSGNTRYSPDQTTDNQIVIGFHQTSHNAAYSIAKTGIRPSADGWIGPGTYFATSLNHTEFKANQFGAYVCALVDLGKTKRIKETKAWSTGDTYDTVYYEHPRGCDEFCVHNPKQIRSWIIVVEQDPDATALQQKNNAPLPNGKYVEDYLEEIVYRGCLV